VVRQVGRRSPGTHCPALHRRHTGHRTGALLDVVGETLPLGQRECEDRAVRVLAVPDEHTLGAGLGRDLDALAAIAPAVAGGTPAEKSNPVKAPLTQLYVRSRKRQDFASMLAVLSGDAFTRRPAGLWFTWLLSQLMELTCSSVTKMNLPKSVG
jgi:hypothetical protein